MSKLTKDQLVDLVAEVVVLDEGTKSTKKNARAYLDGVITAIHTALANGDTVPIQGHGVYETRTRAARVGRNPQTGEALNIPETKTVGFRATGIKAVVKNAE
jgi:DNA-binding protein HU-beta